MKKVLFFIISFFILYSGVSADEKVNVLFSKCVDGDTAYFILNEKQIKVRFLAIDTPESVSTQVKEEEYGKEASNFTCKKIKSASKIELEFDKNSDKQDKYNRYLAWVWVDDYLLQDLIIQNGYAEVAYLYGDYKYTSLLQDHQEVAKAKKLNIWSDSHTNNNTLYLYIGCAVLLIICLFCKSIRKKTISKLKIYIKKTIK